jgi:hypothetical protein
MVTNCNYLLFFYGRTSRNWQNRYPAIRSSNCNCTIRATFWKSCKTMGGSKSKFTKLCSLKYCLAKHDLISVMSPSRFIQILVAQQC